MMLSPARNALFAVLAANPGGLSVADLVAQSGASAGAIKTMLYKQECLGLTERLHGFKPDGRVVLWVLTDAGMRVARGEAPKASPLTVWRDNLFARPVYVTPRVYCRNDGHVGIRSRGFSC